jgi:HD-GYP domain-containing protein (c-di-GMP phosphodiesterase class II)
MSFGPARSLRDTGIKAGTALLLQAPHIVDEVQASLPVEEREQVDLLIRVMDGFDRATAEHLEAVGTLSALLARRAGLDLATVATCLLAGRVHDIGKLAISRSTLCKPGPLSKDEWDEIKLHPAYGGSTLAGLPRLKRLAAAVIAHHERIDGGGYPYGLGGDEIPIESQIVAIAGAFCAMTSPQPFRATLLPGEAIAELERCAGTQFNAELVSTFGAMFRERPLVAAPDPI